MKKLNKALAIALAVMLAAMMSLAAFAAGSYTITITPDNSDTAPHTYEAYQIFKGDLAEVTTGEGDAAVTTKTLSNI